MVDKWAMEMVGPLLKKGSALLARKGVCADHVTLTGFFIGILAVPALAWEWYGVALLLILLNRLCDGLDGALARMTNSTDAGGFLDIVLDFIFYSAVIFGFALAEPENNGLAAAALIFSFVGTGSSFLTFAIMAEKRKLQSMIYPYKGFYYLGGLTEGTETLLCFVLLCLFPRYFNYIAWTFAALCGITTVMRVWGGYHSLRTVSDDVVSVE